MDQNDHSSAECLPVSFFRPEGVSLDYGRLNEERLARKIKVPVQTDIESPVPSLEVYPVSDAKHVQNLIKAYSDQELSEETKERHIDLLEHIQRDLRSHAVVRADADGALQGFVIIRRAVEYVSSNDGNPSTVRMIHDILDSFEIADGVLDAITAACNVMVLSDVYHLHRSASEIAGEIRGSPFDDDEFGPDISSEEVLSVRVECHLKGRAGSQDDVVRAFGETIETYSGHLGDFDELSGMAGPAYVVGPFLPGIWFTEDEEQGQDTHEDLRRREILRTASLIAYSDIRRIRPDEDRTMLPGLRNPELVAEFASPEVMDIASLALDPNEPHPATVFGGDLSDIRMAQIGIADLQDRSFSAFFGLRRTLSLTVNAGFMSPLTLDIKVCHAVGEAQHEHIGERLAEVMMEQVVSDLTSLTASLAEYEGRVQVRFRVPGYLLRSTKKVVNGDWPEARKAVLGKSTQHEFSKPVVIEDQLWPHRGEPYTPRQLFVPMPVEEEIRVEELSAFMEEACMDAVGDLTAEVERIEVLRLEEDQAVWIDVEEMDGSTCVEPFLLLRGWVQGVAVPAVMSMLTLQKEEIHDFQIADPVRDFSHTLGSNEHDWTSTLAVPPSIEALHSAAKRLFRRAEIHVAPLNVVTLVTKDTMMIFGDDLDLSERHKLLQGCELWPSAPNAFDPTYLGPKSVEFMVAVHDDLRVGAKKGVEAVLATFLSRRVHQLLESGERPESAALVQFLAQLYVRKALGPPEANLLDLANSDDLIRDLASAGIGPIRPDILKSGVATSRVFDPPPEGAPIYLITAAIAEAYETLLEKLWQRPANV